MGGWELAIVEQAGFLPGSHATPGGATNDIQYNDAGTFGGDSGLTWDKTLPVFQATLSTDGQFNINGADNADFQVSIGPTQSNSLGVAGGTSGNTVFLDASETNGTVQINAHKSVALASETDSIFLQDNNGNVGVEVAQGPKLGFYATPAIVKPTVTGSRGGNAGVASLLTQLAALGLIIDSTTAGTSGVIQKATLAITSAQLKALNTTPLDIVAAPGAGMVICVIAASFAYTFNTAGYTPNGTLALFYNGKSAATSILHVNQTGFIDQSASQVKVPPLSATFDGTQTPLFATSTVTNKSLQVGASGNPSTGSGTLTVTVWYDIVPAS